MAIAAIYSAAAVENARAEDSNPAASGTLDPANIIVTAQKRSQNVQDIPLTVNAVSGEQLAERQVRNLQDLESQVSGLKFDTANGFANISIRGAGTTFFTGAGESSVAMHVDGVYIGQPRATSLGVMDISAIEVLRGPQGTLYGRNATAGVINFNTVNPTREMEAGGSLRYGNYDAIRGQAYVSGPLSDTVRVRIYGEGERRDGWGRNDITGQQLGNLKSYGGRAALSWDVTPDWTADLRLLAKNERSNPLPNQPFRADSVAAGVLGPPFTTLEPRHVLTDLLVKSKRVLKVASLKNSFSLTDKIDLVSLTGYADFKFDTIFDGLNAYITPPLTPTVQPPFRITQNQESKQFSQEFNLTQATGDLQWLLGLYYLRDKTKSGSTSVFDSLASGGLSLNPAFKFWDFITDQSGVRTSMSAFFDGTYRLGETTRLFGGARILREKYSQDLDVIFLFGNTNRAELAVPNCLSSAVDETVKDTAVTGRAGVQQDIGANSMAYAQYSTGYKSAGFSQNQCNNPYQPETIQAQEIGLKTQLFNRRLTLNLSAYHYSIKNLELEQVTIFGDPVINVPRSRVWGLDVEARARPTDAWGIDASFTFLNAKYKRFYNQDASFGVPTCATPASPATCPAGSNLAGIPLNKSPKVSGLIGTDYEFDLGEPGKIKLRAEAYLTSKMQLREYRLPQVIQKGYTLLNFYATYTSVDDRFKVSGYLKNARDKDYITSVTPVLGGAMGTYGVPREYGVELAVNFR